MNKKTVLNILLGLAALYLLWASRAWLAETWALFSDREALTDTITRAGIWGPATLFVLFLLQVFLAFIPGQILMITSGYLYGFIGGILITWVSLVAGGQVAFWLARRYGRPFAEKYISAPTLDRWDKSAAGQGVGFYVFTLVLPFFPNDAMCYVAGLGNMPFRKFLLANALGRGIASFLTVFVGANVNQIPALIWVFVAGFIVLGVIGWLAIRRYNKS